MTRVHPRIYKCPLRFVLKLLFAKSLVYTFATRGRDCARNRLLREEEDEEKKRRRRTSRSSNCIKIYPKAMKPLGK